jgi:hypothetical protein
MLALVLLAGIGCRGSMSSPDPVRLFDGFEGESVGSFWRAGNYGSGRYEPGAISISRLYARTGNSSVRITVRQGDIAQINDEDGTYLERAELDSGSHAILNRDVWAGFSFLIPKDFPVVNDRLIFAQWKQHGFRKGPWVAERFQNGKHYLTIRTPDAAAENKAFPLPEIIFGRWNDMVYHVRFSSGRDGRVEVWMNGVQAVSQAGPNCLAGGENSFYHKIGLYRDIWKEPMTIFFDDYTLDESREAVDPSRFDRKGKSTASQGVALPGLAPSIPEIVSLCRLCLQWGTHWRL